MDENKVIVLHKGFGLEELAANMACCKSAQNPTKAPDEEER